MRGWIAYVLGVVVVTLILAVGFIVTLNRMVTKAAEGARAERDAYWEAQIANLNTEAERALRLQAERAAAAEAEIQAKLSATQRQLTELEKDNDALPDAAGCGLARDRVRLLHR